MSNQTVLIVDDEPINLAVLNGALADRYALRAANSGARALQLARQAPRPSLILLDIQMPGMDGYQVLAELQQDPATRDIPVIFVTTMDATADEQTGLDLGAVDYITKPYNPAILRARVRTHLTLKQASDFLKDQNAFLEAEIGRRMEENLVVQNVSIHALANLAETRDNETGEHIQRTQLYVNTLARRLQQHPRFSATLTDRYIDLATRSAPLHDIGKVGIPDQVLLKPGKLTAEEWVVMKTHAALGAEAIEKAEREVERPVAFLVLAKEIARWHHERWDGGGYPDGLAGEAIPVAARLMALADVFDALISVRVYKPAMPPEQAREIIAAERGRQFDPDLVDAFLDGFEEFVAIARKYQG